MGKVYPTVIANEPANPKCSWLSLSLSKPQRTVTQVPLSCGSISSDLRSEVIWFQYTPLITVGSGSFLEELRIIMINWLKLAKRCCARITNQDQLSRFYALRSLAITLLPEYRFKWPQMDWWNDPTFNQYLERFDETDGMNCDRRWMLHQLLRLVSAVPGDTAECGVFSGSSSFVICSANREAIVSGKRHHLFDSFEGLSAPEANDGDHWQPGDLSYGLERVQENLSQFDGATSYYPGWIPDRFADVENVGFSFVHIDVDLYQPTRDSMAFFYDRMAPGGVILVDDYGFTSCPGATQAVDEVLTGKPEAMLRLSGGGGFIVKGIQTAIGGATRHAA